MDRLGGGAGLRLRVSVPVHTQLTSKQIENFVRMQEDRYADHLIEASIIEEQE